MKTLLGVLLLSMAATAVAQDPDATNEQLADTLGGDVPSAQYLATDVRLDKEAAAAACNGNVDEECITTHFADTLEASQIRGAKLFQYNCKLCHGTTGEGDGRAARLHNPPPFNLTYSALPRAYAAHFISQGGQAMGRSDGMPVWGLKLSDQEITDIVNHIASIRVFQHDY